MYNNPYAPQSTYSGYDQYYQPPKNFGYSRSNYDDTMRDYNAKFADQINNTVERGRDLHNIEFQLDQERKQTKVIRQQIESDLDREKELRLEFENRIIRLREEQQQNELRINDLEYKYADKARENEVLIQDNRQMHNEFVRAQEQFNGKVRELEDRCKQTTRQLQQQDEKYRIEIDRVTKQYEHRIQDMTNTWKLQKADYDAQIDSYKRTVADLNQDITNAMNETMRVRIEAEEEIRETVVKVQEEEMRKYMAHIRSIEQKLRLTEENKDQLLRQNNEQLAQLAEKDRLIKTKAMDYDQAFSKYKQDLNEFQNQLNQSQIARDKLRNELVAREGLVQQQQADLMALQRQFAKLKEQHLQEISQIQTDNQAEKREMDKARDQLSNQLNQQDRANRQMEQEIERLNLELESLGEKIQNNVGKSINQALNQTTLATRLDNRKPFIGQKY